MSPLLSFLWFANACPPLAPNPALVLRLYLAACVSGYVRGEEVVAP